MNSLKIYFSNLGYARGLNGCLKQHFLYGYRHIYCPLKIQQQSLAAFKQIIIEHNPDIGCIVEIDKGSLNTGYFNQMQYLSDERYPFYSINSKYTGKKMHWLSVFNGKSNAFFAKGYIPYTKLYFKFGTKKLIYRLALANGIALYFAHFSLSKKVRAQQYDELLMLIKNDKRPVVILGNFNNFYGFSELKFLIAEGNLTIVNQECYATFRLHNRYYPIDLCLCSKGLKKLITLNIILQPFSDHCGLLVTLKRKS
jgi:hypothetical protein